MRVFLLVLLSGIILCSGCISGDKVVKLYECPNGQLVEKRSDCPTTTIETVTKFEPLTVHLGDVGDSISLIKSKDWNVWNDDNGAVVVSPPGTKDKKFCFYYFVVKDDNTLEDSVHRLYNKIDEDNDPHSALRIVEGIKETTFDSYPARYLKYQYINKTDRSRKGYGKTYWINLESGFVVIQYTEGSSENDDVRDIGEQIFNSIRINHHPQSTTSTLSTTTTSILEELKLNVGETAKFDEVSVTVHEVKIQNSYTWWGTYSKSYQVESADPGKKFIIVNAEVINQGDRSAYVHSGDFSVTDSEGYHYDDKLYQGDQDFPSQRLYPGQKARGIILFEVPKSSVNLKLYYDFSDFFSGLKLVSWDIESSLGSDVSSNEVDYPKTITINTEEYSAYGDYLFKVLSFRMSSGNPEEPDGVRIRIEKLNGDYTHRTLTFKDTKSTVYDIEITLKSIKNYRMVWDHFYEGGGRSGHANADVTIKIDKKN